MQNQFDNDYITIIETHLFNDLFFQIENATFLPISNSLFEIIQIEGIDEEFNVYKKNKWKYFQLKLPKNISTKLKQYDPTIINLFNKFDILLKNKYSMKYIDLIDYDKGTIIIITPNKK